jgi:aminopeptidase N
MVTCGSWEDIWLNEGFATYLEGISRERFHPGDWKPWKQGRINSITGQAGGSVRVDDTSSVGRIFSGRLTYNKGAYLLHMLRWKLGNEAFFQGVRNYLEARRFNYAITPQFKAHLEAASGQDLTEYFADWYYGQGYPSYQLLWSQDAGKQLSLTLSQTQSHPGVSFFEMPVPIRFYGPQGDTTVVVQHTVSGQSFSISLPFEVDNAQIDPELWLVSANNTVTKSTSGSTEAHTFAGLNISPNPCVGQTKISISDAAMISQIDLFDAQGKLLKTYSGLNMHTQVLDLSLWPAACYEIRVQSDDKIYTGKIIRN